MYSSRLLSKMFWRVRANRSIDAYGRQSLEALVLGEPPREFRPTDKPSFVSQVAASSDLAEIQASQLTALLGEEKLICFSKP
jgi:hypothetical protein